MRVLYIGNENSITHTADAVRKKYTSLETIAASKLTEIQYYCTMGEAPVVSLPFGNKSTPRIA